MLFLMILNRLFIKFRRGNMHTNIRYNYYMIIINYDFTNNSIDNFILIFIARILNVMSCIEWTNEMLASPSSSPFSLKV